MIGKSLSDVSLRRNLPALVLACVGYSALAVALTFPLVLHLSTHLPKDPGDPLIAASLLWWNAHVPPLTERWWDGPGMFPAHGMMAFSAHFLGASLIAAPLQWIGLNAIAAYNLTFLASFTLAAVAAHALALTLTRRHDAAVICGLAFGFNPFRVAHIEHLDLLLAFAMPIALVALHRYLDERRRRWLAVLTGALVLQALSSSYYALFFTVFFALWIAWFIRPHAWRDLVALCAAGATAVLLVSPIVAGYASVHAGYNWRRDLAEEITRFSADLSSFVTASPLSSLWGWTAPLNGAERQLFPGLTITALAIAGLVMASRGPAVGRDRWATASRLLWIPAAVFAVVAAAAVLVGPWGFEAGWVRVSVTAPYKPFSVALALAVTALLSTATVRHAFRSRCALVFYLLAAAALFVCSLGPEPTALGEQVLYEPPYAWLMRLPLFGDTVRAPARFAMLGILALSIAASLAFHQLWQPRSRRIALVLAIAGIVGDGWMQPLPLAAVPRGSYEIAPHHRDAAVLELPLGDVWRDTAAIYRSTLHGVRAVNGYNGFEPIYYQVLRRGLADRDHTILEALAGAGPLLVAVDRTADADRRIRGFLDGHPQATRSHDDGQWTLYWVRGSVEPEPSPGCARDPIPVAAASSPDGELHLAAVVDQDSDTRWIVSEQEEEGDDEVTLDLGDVQHPCALELSMGEAAVYYPGLLQVDTSVDGVTWERAFSRRTAGLALRAALANPRDARIVVPLQGRPARFVRLRSDQGSAIEPWAISDLRLR